MPRATKRQRQAERAKRLARLREAAAILATKVCPQCGAKLVRNTSLTGWWQCGAYACEAMRKMEFAGLPSCSFQMFFDPTPEENQALLKEAALIAAGWPTLSGICLCGAPMQNGVCSVDGCVCSSEVTR
jgi:hypothetical protein